LIAGTAFVLFQWGYLYVQRWMTSYNAIYGSFAALPLFLVWMQTSWQILLFGGELSFAYQNVARFCEERESLRISFEQRRKIWLAMMLTVVGQFREKGGATSTETIRRHLELPTRIINDVLYQLVQAGQLVAVPMSDDDRDMGFMPAHDIATITLGGVLDALEQSGQGNFDPVPTPEFSRAEHELARLERSARKSQENVRIIDLLDTK
ncbi:MAG: YihY/virulence factor BrkB family protein, partial [Alistipes sp.]|nr:YihY/virulence factor BrkB family protein [Alistipes sp.]